MLVPSATVQALAWTSIPAAQSLPVAACCWHACACGCRAGCRPDDEAVLAAHQSALEAAAVSLHEQHQAKYWTDYLQVGTACQSVLHAVTADNFVRDGPPSKAS